MDNSLSAFLKGIGIIDPHAIESLLRYGQSRKAPAGAQLFLAGRPFGMLWYVESGMVRAYRIVDGKDYTFFFFPERHFAADYESYLTNQESLLFFEALTAVQYLQFNKQAISQLYRQHPCFERLGRIMAERAYLSATSRLKQFQTESLEQRYEKLLQQAPQLFQQIPQYHIASYLGVSPQSLSRIRAQRMNTDDGT